MKKIHVVVITALCVLFTASCSSVNVKKAHDFGAITKVCVKHNVSQRYNEFLEKAILNAFSTLGYATELYYTSKNNEDPSDSCSHLVVYKSKLKGTISKAFISTFYTYDSKFGKSSIDGRVKYNNAFNAAVQSEADTAVLSAYQSLFKGE